MKEIKLNTVKFDSNGDVICYDLDDEPGTERFTWTKGAIVDLAHPIMEDYSYIEDGGKTYLIFPWIDDKVVNQGYAPSCYVLEKME